ncbi:hypothetical protein [uncultured Erythrobacter sp.]|uniref:hypothetical protein n=1 Tax=uncultured Erythrobacter sp. TaxID=263913 RepID=UPI002634BB30|nr:hypothetical protein [uncultured Erythrobacter sp.]
MYIPLGAALLTVISSPGLTKVLGISTASPAIWVIICGILVAGIAGAVVATACITAQKFEDVWENKIGAYGAAPMSGRWWAKLEHAAFWCAVIAFGLLMLG